MKHYIEEIRADHLALNAEAQHHITECKHCTAELELMKTIERAVVSIPEQTVPRSLKSMVMMKVLLPAYRLWHVLAALVLSILSPILFKYLAGQYDLASDSILPITIILYAVLTPLLIIPLINLLFRQYRTEVENLSARADAYLEARASKTH